MFSISPSPSRDNQSQTLILPSGRTLGYASYGDPNGIPLLYFHGYPSSRLEASGLSPLASRLNIRLLALDRPGAGLSTYDPHRRVTDWPADVQAFATGLGLSRIAVLGVSGGGPYALACARLLPSDMLGAVGMLAGAPMWDRGVRTNGMPWYARITYLMATYWPWGLRVLSAGFVGGARWVMGRAVVERWIDKWLEGLSEARAKAQAKAAAETEKEERQRLEHEKGGDIAKLETAPLIATTRTTTEEGYELQETVLPTPERRARLIQLLFEHFAQGTAGFVHETRLLTRDWGFRFDDITYDTVRIWHGSRDANAPIGSIRGMAARMPHCVLTEFDDTHFSVGSHYEDVLREIMADFKKTQELRDEK